MLESILIRNFQTHEKLKIKFDPKITTIAGPSDVGKSSIIRALTWALLNRPRGKAFLRDGAEEVKVVLRFDEGIKLVRSRGNQNLYKLNSSTFEAFGSTVPDEISRILRVSELNIQFQHESSGFWLGLSAGEFARQLNSIIDLDVIDSTLSNLAGDLRKARTEEEIITSRIDSAKEERKKVLRFRKANKALQKIENLRGKVEGRKAKRDSLTELLTEVRDLFHKTQIKVPVIGPLEVKGQQLKKVRKERTYLESLVRNIQADQHRVNRLRKELQETEIELHERMGNECPLCNQPIQ